MFLRCLRRAMSVPYCHRNSTGRQCRLRRLPIGSGVERTGYLGFGPPPESRPERWSLPDAPMLNLPAG